MPKLATVPYPHLVFRVHFLRSDGGYYHISGLVERADGSARSLFVDEEGGRIRGVRLWSQAATTRKAAPLTTAGMAPPRWPRSSATWQRSRISTAGRRRSASTSSGSPRRWASVMFGLRASTVTAASATAHPPTPPMPSIGRSPSGSRRPATPAVCPKSREPVPTPQTTTHRSHDMGDYYEEILNEQIAV